MIGNLAESDPFRPKGYRAHWAGILLASMAINILSLAVPIMTLQVYDRILPNNGSGTLPVLVGGVCLAIILEAILRIARSHTIGWNGAAYEHRLGCNALQHFLGADLSKIGPINLGEQTNRMAAIGKLKDFYNGYIITTVSELLFVPVFLGLIYYIAGPLVMMPSLILISFMAVSIFQGRELREAMNERDHSDDHRYDFLIESLEGIHTIKSFALENAFSRRYEALEKTSTRANYRLANIMASVFNAGTVFSHIMVAAVVITGALWTLEGHLTTGGLIATILLSGRIMQPVQRGLALWARYQDFAIAREKMESIFDTKQHEMAANQTEITREGSLRLENLSFRYSEHNAWVLEHVNMELSPKECVLLDCNHAEAKSVLLKLISGIYPPSHGRVIIDGSDVQRFTPIQLTQHVAYIQPDSLIFRGTIRDNLTCFGQIDEAQAREVSNLLKISQEIARLPAGFETVLEGNQTDSIPPGLKQRIAMARSLAPKPRLVLFDQADRGLDHAGYNMIYKLLAQLKGKATLLLVSDDKNIRSLADRVITMNAGTVSETHENEQSKARPFQELRL